MPEARRLSPISFIASAVMAALAPVAAIAAAPDSPPGFAAAYLVGHVAERRGDADVAANNLAKALKLSPDIPALRRRVVRLQTMEGQFDAAAEGAETLAAAGDDNFPIGLVRLTARFKSGDYAGARAIAEDPRANGLSPVVAQLAAGWAAAGAGDIDGGAKILTDAAKDNEALKELFTLHAALLAEQGGRIEVARWLYDDAMAAATTDDRPPSGRLVQAVLGFFERQGLDEDAAALKAKADADQISLNDAVLTGMIAEDPAGGLGEAFFNFAVSLYSQRQFREALIYGRLSQALRPGAAETLFNIGQILESSGRPLAAAAAYEATPKVGSYAWRAPLRTAESLADAGKQEEAIAAMRAVVAATETEARPAITLGHMLRAVQRFGDAVEAYDEAIRRKGGLGPDDGWLRYSRGVALERSGDWEQAEKEFLIALDHLGDEPLLLNYLGYTWIDRGENLERARDMVARAVELRPDDGFMRDSLGWAEYRLGDYEAAVASLERAIAEQPLDPIINEHLGDAYWQVGRHREARFQWRRALSFEPEEKLVPIIEGKLKCGIDGCESAADAGGADAEKPTDGDGG